MPSMSEHTQEKSHDQTAALMDTLLHAKSKISTSNSFWDIKIYKIMQSDCLEYFQLQLKNYIFHSHVVFEDSQRRCII